MSRGEWISVAGIGVGLFFALPKYAPEYLPVALVLVILSVIAYTFWMSGLPPYTVLSHHFNIEIVDPEGREARARKTVTLRPNHPGQDHYAHRDFTLDGSITDIRTDPGVKIVEQYKAAGDHTIYVKFPSHLRRFKPVETWIELDCVDTFTSPNEGAILTIDQPLKKATIEITLPAQKQPRNARAIKRYSGKDEELSAPKVMGQRISWSLSRRFRGLPYGQYEVSWDWNPGP